MTTLSKAVGPLVQVWAGLITTARLLSEKDGDPDNPFAELDIPWSLTDAMKQLTNCLKLLGHVNVQLIEHRCWNLHSILDISVCPLADKKNSFTDQLFGDDVRKAHQEVKAAYQLTHSLTRRCSHGHFPYAGQGRGHFQCRGWGMYKGGY